MQNLTKLGCVLIFGVYGAVGSIVPHQNSTLEKVNSSNSNLIQNSMLHPIQENKIGSEILKNQEPQEWNLCVSYLEDPKVKADGRLVTVKCRITEEDQYKNIRDRVIEKDVPLLTKREFIPNSDGEKSQLILRNYIEVNDVKELAPQDRLLELCDQQEIELPNQKELTGWQHDDSTLKSKQLSKIYAEYEGEKFYVDQLAKFRDGNSVKEYVLSRSELLKARNFEDGVYDCVEVIPNNYYKRPDGSEYRQTFPAEIQKSHKPIKTKPIGWHLDDSKLTATQTLQDFVISCGNELNVGTVKNGAIQGYVKEHEVVQNVGKLTFVNGQLEQKKVATVNYRRPDGSLYTLNNVQIASEIQGIPHTVTYSNGAWRETAHTFRQGTFQAFNGCFGVVDGNIFTKYQKDGTVIRRPALLPELAAFAPTKTIPRYWIKGGSFFHHSRTIRDGSIEVLYSCPCSECKPTWAGHDGVIPPRIRPFIKQPVNWNAIFTAE